MESLEDFEEYTVGYRDIWTYPVVRWMLSTLPSSMIFDDHEISNEWNTSQAWLDEKRQTDWYEGRVIGGLMAYWIYQHLGNLSPAELAEDEAFGRCRTARTAARSSATSPSGRAPGGPLPVQLLPRPRPGAADHPRLAGRPAARGRQAPDHERRTSGTGSRTRPTASTSHLLMAQLAADPAAPRDARHRGLVGGGRRRRLGQAASSRWGRRSGSAANLDHWACFQKSYRELEQLVIDIAVRQLRRAAGVDRHVRRRRPPLLRLRGRPAGRIAAPSTTKVWHAVCSGLRKELQLNERLVLGLGHTWIAAKLGRLLAADGRA